MEDDLPLSSRALEIRIVKNLMSSRRDKEGICPGRTNREFTEARVLRKVGRTIVFVIIIYHGIVAKCTVIEQ